MGNAAAVAVVEEMSASEALRVLKEDVQRQMKDLKAAGQVPAASGGAATTAEHTDQGGEAALEPRISIQVPRNAAKLLDRLQSRVAALEHTIQLMHSGQALGDEAIACLLRANPEPGAEGMPSFVFDALDVPVDADPFPALSQRPVQVLRVRNFVMQEDRTARLVTGLKSPLSRALCELHFVNCEWDLIQAEDVAAAVVGAGLRINVLDLSHSQKLRGDTFAGFAAAMVHLRTLDLEHCQHIDDQSMVRPNCSTHSRQAQQQCSACAHSRPCAAALPFLPACQIARCLPACQIACLPESQPASLSASPSGLPCLPACPIASSPSLPIPLSAPDCHHWPAVWLAGACVCAARCWLCVCPVLPSPRRRSWPVSAAASAC